jgi:hypothetical protein
MKIRLQTTFEILNWSNFKEGKQNRKKKEKKPIPGRPNRTFLSESWLRLEAENMGKSYLTPLASGTSRRVPSSLRCNPNGPAHLELVFCFFFFFSFPVSASFLLFFYFKQNTDFK